MNWFTATVAMRPLAMRAGNTAPARSTWAMIQPPKMSPLLLESAGMGITRITNWRSLGSCKGASESTDKSPVDGEEVEISFMMLDFLGIP